ncbi:MAG: hypothetical protein KIT14_11155 [bacterium]|nr:hypothetical protein [bacterium]
MATKAERHRWEQERAKPDKPKQPKRKRRDMPVDTAKPGVSASDRKVGAGSTAARNRSTHAAKKATYALEDSATGRPSRKSSRRAKNRAKPNSNLTRQRQREVRSPEARATQAAARKR